MFEPAFKMRAKRPSSPSKSPAIAIESAARYQSGPALPVTIARAANKAPRTPQNRLASVRAFGIHVRFIVPP